MHMECNSRIINTRSKFPHISETLDFVYTGGVTEAQHLAAFGLINTGKQ